MKVYQTKLYLSSKLNAQLMIKSTSNLWTIDSQTCLNLPKPVKYVIAFIFQKELIKGHYHKDSDTR